MDDGDDGSSRTSGFELFLFLCSTLLFNAANPQSEMLMLLGMVSSQSSHVVGGIGMNEKLKSGERKFENFHRPLSVCCRVVFRV